MKKKERLQNDNELRMSNKEYYKERYQREKHLYQKYYQTHKEEIIKKRAEYYHKNKERISERRKELYREKKLKQVPERQNVPEGIKIKLNIKELEEKYGDLY